MLALLDAYGLVPSALTPEQLQRVRTTVDYIRTLRLPSGNYPSQPGKARGWRRLRRLPHTVTMTHTKPEQTHTTVARCLFYHMITLTQTQNERI